MRWKEAWEAGVAPPVILASTHISALEFVGLEQLKFRIEVLAGVDTVVVDADNFVDPKVWLAGEHDGFEFFSVHVPIPGFSNGGKDRLAPASRLGQGNLGHADLPFAETGFAVTEVVMPSADESIIKAK